MSRRRRSAAQRLRGVDRRPASATAHVVGFALLFISVGMAACGVIEAATDGHAATDLLMAAAGSALAGLALWLGTQAPTRVSTASAFAAVAWTWIAISVAGALPFWTSGMLANPGDAIFESVSGFTGTGATVLTPISTQGRGLLMWRQATQWYGGMGVIVLAVAVLPLLGIGGYELLRAESPGPTSDRLAPRVSDTAKRLWIVYLGLTLVMLGLLMLGGMSFYDGIAHAMTTVSTGGFSPYDASIAAFDSVTIEVILIGSMTAGAISFTLWWQLFTGAGLRTFFRSAELRAFLGVAVTATAFIAAVLSLDGTGVVHAVRDASFATMTTLSTTGFATADFALWPPATQLVILAMMVTGGMAGSTSGAVKLFRIQVMAAHSRRELRRVLHPRGVFPVKLGGSVVPEQIVRRIVSFFVLYVFLAVIGTAVLTSLGADLVTAASAITSCIGAFGPALGKAGPTSNYLVLNAPSRGILTIYMLLGRLELFTLLLMFAAPLQTLRNGRRGSRSVRSRR
ncbi:MAG: TrkH family potassium uptake protein [Acidimicrobiales bacterium]